MNSPKILILDIETAPAQVYSWGMFQQDHGINQVIQDGYVLCWCAKWYGEKEIMSDSLINHTKTFNKNPTDDSKIAKSVWKLLDEADFVVTHNGVNFDIKWLNTIFVKNKLPPAQGYRNIDTFIEAKRNFHFLSNKLDFICRKLDLGRKISTGGFELWIDCMKGVKSSWKKMVTYCKNDVGILEKLYGVLRPFMKTHPNLMAFYGGVTGCPNCGSTDFHKRGFYYRVSGVSQAYVCNKCFRKFSDRKKEKK